MTVTPRSVIRAGGVVSGGGGGVHVTASTTFESGDQFGTSSEVFSANQYRVEGVRPTTVKDSNEPGVLGAGVVTGVAEPKFVSSIGPTLE